MIWIYFALIFQCLDLIPGRAVLIKSLALLSFNPSNTIFVKLDWWCFNTTYFINLTFLRNYC